MSCVVYTVGHSTQSLDAFVELCRTAEIALICDVRRFPRSRRHPQFTRERLERDLASRGIGYAWLGDALGGMRDAGYEQWMTTDTFAQGLAELEGLAAEHVAAFMCAEGLPAKCHRRFVADALAVRGHHVAHLLPDGRIVWVQPQLSLPDP